jgi:hypothetical protein
MGRHGRPGAMMPTQDFMLTNEWDNENWKSFLEDLKPRTRRRDLSDGPYFFTDQNARDWRSGNHSGPAYPWIEYIPESKS